MQNSKLIVCALMAMSAITSIGPASAADMAVKSPYAAAPPLFSWSGFYVGLHAGYGWGENNWNFGGVFEDPSISRSRQRPKTDGVLGGVQAGANYQFASWVVGMEWDLAFLSRKGSFDDPLLRSGVPIPGFNITATSKFDWLTQFTGRAGYALDRTLFYVKGGIAAGETKDNLSLAAATAPPQFIDFGTKTNLLVGWTVGAGIEHFFTPNWSAKIEYNYVDLGSSAEKFNFTNGNASLTFLENIQHKLQIVKVGANYKFNSF